MSSRDVLLLDGANRIVCVRLCFFTRNHCPRTLAKRMENHVNVRIYIRVYLQKYGGSENRQHAKTGTVGDAETGHEGTAGTSRADHQGHDPSTTARARRHGDGQGPIAEPEQQDAERATSVAHQPRHSGHAEERPGGLGRRRRRFVGQGVIIRLRGQLYYNILLLLGMSL